MTQETLEEKTSTTEETESTQTEETKSTETEEKSTVSITDTPEFKKALDRAVGKGVSSIQSQLSISKATAEATKTENEVLKSLQEDTERMVRELEERQFAEDPEALKGFRNTKSIELREKKATLREQKNKLVEIEQDNFRNAMALDEVAKELRTRYQVPRKILELCNSKEQMEEIASDYPEVGEKKDKDPEKTPKFAGAGEQGKGTDLNKMSSTELISRAVSKMNK